MQCSLQVFCYSTFHEEFAVETKTATGLKILGTWKPSLYRNRKYTPAIATTTLTPYWRGCHVTFMIPKSEPRDRFLPLSLRHAWSALMTFTWPGRAPNNETCTVWYFGKSISFWSDRQKSKLYFCGRQSFLSWSCCCCLGLSISMSFFSLNDFLFSSIWKRNGKLDRLNIVCLIREPECKHADCCRPKYEMIPPENGRQ